MGRGGVRAALEGRKELMSRSEGFSLPLLFRSTPTSSAL